MRLAKLAALALVTTLTTPALAADAEPEVRAIDNWGRHVVTIGMNYLSKNKTWKFVPKGTFHFLAKGAESDDVVTAQFYMGKKAVGPVVKCQPSFAKLRKSAYQVASVYGCMPELEKHGISKGGKGRVVVGYKQLSKGKEFKNLATYYFNIEQHEGAAKEKEFHIKEDFRMGESWIHVKQDGRFQLFTWFKVSRDKSTEIHRGNFKLRCFAGDKKMEMDPLTNSRYKTDFSTYKGAKKNGGQPFFSQWKYNYFFPPGTHKDFLKNNPGKYRCVLTRGGEIDREFHFTVADGAVVKPACQTGANPLVSAPSTTTLIKTVWKTPQDAKFDRAAFSKGAFWGRAGVPKACGF